MKTIEVVRRNIAEWKEFDILVYQKIMEKYYDINVDYEWYDFTISEFTEELEKIGFRNVKIGFSGFWSQGDGANFTGDWSSPDNYYGNIPDSSISEIQALKILLERIGKKHDWNFSIKKFYGGYHYSHENTVSIFNAEFFHVGKQCTESIGERLEEKILTICRDVMRKIYRTLEEEYTYLTSEPAIFETLSVNKYEFDETGRII